MCPYTGFAARVMMLFLMLSVMQANHSAAWATAVTMRSPFAIPVAPQGQKKAGEGKNRCKAPPKPVLTLATTSMYNQNDPTRSQKDKDANARYQKMIGPVREYAQEVTKHANNYVRSGAKTTAFAECTIDWLYGWAREGALTDLRTPQAVFNVGQLLAGFAMAYLEVRDNPHLDRQKKAMIEAWLNDLAGRVRQSITNDYVEGKNSAFANHRYWAGYGVGAAGVAVNNPDHFMWGIDSARIGLREVQPDGSLPRELRRASRARDYHVFSVAPLVMMAELGYANGINLYAEQDHALHRLIRLVLSANKDPSYFEKATGKEQEPYPDGDDGIPSSRLGWLEPYHARFPSALSEEILEDKRSVASTALGGNTTLLYTGKDE